MTGVGGVTSVGLLELTVTDAPPVGAGAARVMVPVMGVPPLSVLGVTVNVFRFAPMTFTVAVLVAPPTTVAVTLTVASLAMIDAVPRNCTLLAPSGITTLAGTLRTPALLLCRLTITPPAGATSPFSKVTLPMVVDPPGVIFNAGLTVIRLRESSDVPRVIDVLS